ncbi:hypothetical protein E5358_12760 [Palleniella muris]|uniref:Uncharacterized protein n=1 Tax=Palleniella muris TaxID=3038145 RepID=A0AC61QNT1_9BACT|nr:hypothetical protein [Palleniella muris]TGX80521.1 hypothetical protein E5358_12760 [Palleniella muris]
MGSKFRFNPSTGTMEAESRVEADTKEQKISQDSMRKVHLKAGGKPNVSSTEGIVQFRERSDYTIFQFIEPRTQNVLGYIGGYALDFSFNLEQIKSTERMEQLLEGMKGLFRKMIAEQILRQVDKK